MKIIDGLKLKGAPAEIPNCSRDDLPNFFVEMGYKVGAEIGVASGDFSELICKVGLKLYAIDPWQIYSDYPTLHDEDQINLQYENTKKILSQYNCKIIRKNSMDALSDIKNGSLDFVYIDGNHQFRYVAEDLCEWSKKVRSGGVVSGHDYFQNRAIGWKGIHVAYVVNAYTATYGITNWYVLGQKKPKLGEKRDHWRSYMWIKP